MTPPHSSVPTSDDLFLRLQAAVAGEYSIERELGRGGMGIVYLAREVRLAREVAIKVLPPALATNPATDALYDALPKTLKKQLAQLPPTVRRFESDAKKLRAEIDRLDESLIALESEASMPSALAASAHESRIRDDRDRLRADLRDTRSRASDRLAATVAALENIRLDLFRLQLGDGGVESVTASLDAAREVGAEIDAYVAATEEVERVLRQPSLAPRISIP